ncbi:MAG: 16S rRNA (guanine(527)-N(7))-methyltransferase RsmG [Burkholderiales bacterium]
MRERELLHNGLAELRLELKEHDRKRLLIYLDLLQKWNQTYNLTAVREPEKMVSHHLLDCLAVLPHLNANHVLDVGTGAGLPGIPLAIARANWQVTLLDSNHKKASFLRQVAMELMLTNVAVHCGRVEDVQSAFDLVISRAFAELGEYLRLAGKSCSAGGTIAAMKGIHPYEELRDIAPPFALNQVIKLNVPGLEAERHLVLISRMQ